MMFLRTWPWDTGPEWRREHPCESLGRRYTWGVTAGTGALGQDWAVSEAYVSRWVSRAARGGLRPGWPEARVARGSLSWGACSQWWGTGISFCLRKEDIAVFCGMWWWGCGLTHSLNIHVICYVGNRQQGMRASREPTWKASLFTIVGRTVLGWKQ